MAYAGRQEAGERALARFGRSPRRQADTATADALCRSRPPLQATRIESSPRTVQPPTGSCPHDREAQSIALFSAPARAAHRALMPMMTVRHGVPELSDRRLGEQCGWCGCSIRLPRCRFWAQLRCSVRWMTTWSQSVVPITRRTAALIGSLCVPSPRGHERATEGDSVDRAGDLDESAGAEDRR